MSSPKQDNPPLDGREAPPVDPPGATPARDTAPPPLTQFAALCWRMHDDRPEVLLITSRDTGRWVVPKGWPMAGRSPAETARREAWEEAGVEGRIVDQAFGHFHYDKRRKRAPALPLTVAVFPLRVKRLAADYPERHQRRRKWFSPEDAARRVAEPELRALILDFAGAAGPAATRPEGAEGVGD